MAEARILLRSDAVAATGDAAEVERKLSWLELLWNDGFVRKTVIILFLAAVWEAYGTFLDNPLLFPTLHDTVITMFERIKDGTIPLRAWASLKVLFMGYSAGIVTNNSFRGWEFSSDAPPYVTAFDLESAQPGPLQSTHQELQRAEDQGDPAPGAQVAEDVVRVADEDV